MDDAATLLHFLRADEVSPEGLEEAWPRLLWQAVKNDIQFPVADALATALDNPPEALVESLAMYRVGLEGFWSTVALTRDLLVDKGLDPVFIKTLRLHTYYDSNLDILVSRDQWPMVDQALAPAGFRRATRRTDLGKFLLEPDKGWYHAPEGLTPVHVYPTVSWHGMEFIPARRVLDGAVERRFLGTTFLGPSWTEDLMIHCAHTVYENYEIKLGELFHIVTVCQKDGIDVGAMVGVAQGHGWARALDLVLGTVKGLWSTCMSGEALDFPIGRQRRPTLPISFPLAYPREELLMAWFQRSWHHALRGRVDYALRELWRHPAYRLYKKVLSKPRGPEVRLAPLLSGPRSLGGERRWPWDAP